MAFYDRLAAEVPPGLVELLRIPGVGPKTVRQLHAELGIESLDDLRAGRRGRHGCATCKGLSAKTEALVLEGIARLETTPKRMLLDQAEATDRRLIEALADTPGVIELEPAGSFRRRRRRSATSTCWPRPTTRAGAHRAVHRRSASSTTSSTRAATRRRSGCCAARRST